MSFFGLKLFLDFWALKGFFAFGLRSRIDFIASTLGADIIGVT